MKLDLQKVSSEYKNLIKDRDSLITTRDKLAFENESLGNEVCNERLIGFEQGIAQCHYFFNTPLNYAEFDIMKVFVDNELVTLSIPEVANAETAKADGVGSEPPAAPTFANEALNIAPVNENTVA